MSQLRVDDLTRTTAAADDLVFGVVRSYVGKGGGGAVFLGLVKNRQQRIRPTLLGQTDVTALRFHFVNRRLELATRPLISRSNRNAVPLLDLRPRGAPVAVYAAKIAKLTINGVAITLDRPALAVIDTGTTGVSVSEALLGPCDGPNSLPTQWRDASVELKTEGASRCVLAASVRKRPSRSAMGDAAAAAAAFDVDLPLDAAEFNEFPLVVSPIKVPWFEPGFGEQEDDVENTARANRRAAETAQRRIVRQVASATDGLGPEPYVLFLGLAFLWRRTLTIDIDARRMLVE